ncbi:hypothetical protein JCM10908_000059 [Rhodotorula pacifica]|uniref:uncharacterized protein n=1 Tax=Rhodotorula pacifica TaxID=1495444 RepID=UPI003170944C
MEGCAYMAHTLDTLPTELKLKIAAYLDPFVPLDSRWSQMALNDAESYRGAVQALSLVSRSWAAVLKDLRWQTLHLRPDESIASLLELARDYMPRIGAKVKTLLFVRGPDNKWPSEAWVQQQQSQTQQTAKRAACLFLNTLDIKPGSVVDVQVVRDALIARIVSACANVGHFAYTGPAPTHSKQGKVIDPSQHDALPFLSATSMTRAALDKSGPTIQSADLRFAHALSTNSLREIASGIEHFPNLMRLTLSAPRGRSSIPGYTNLSIVGAFEPSVLAFFDSAPLKNVEFCGNRDKGTGQIGLKRFKSFLETHRLSLNSFVIEAPVLGARNVTEVSRLLEENGIGGGVVEASMGTGALVPRS